MTDDYEIWSVAAPLHDVSTLGRVRSWHGRNKGNILKFGVDHNGYYTVYLGRNNKKYVHQLVLEIFTGPRPDGLHACHKNDVPTDNRLSNLEWGTPKHNRAQSRLNGGMCVGSAHPQSKLTEDKVREMRRLRNEGATTAELGRLFGVCQVTASQATRGDTWVHV